MEVQKIIDHIGYNGPIILIGLSAFFLRNKRKMLFIYCLGSLVNFVITIVLKMIIKQPRPSDDNLDLEWTHQDHKRTKTDMYGMPSGHAQMVFFSTIFIFCVLRDYYLLILFLTTSLITVKQRFDYKNHTVEQLLVGAILGIIIGYLFCEFGKKYVSE